MTGSAVVRGVILAMARNAGAHSVFHEGLGCNGVGHVAMAGGAGNFVAGMGPVAKLHCGSFLETVDSLPGDFPTTGGNGGQFLNLGLVGRNLRMTKHALSNAGNGCGVPRIRGNVTVNTLQVDFVDVRGVGEENRLLGAHSRHGNGYGQEQQKM